MIVFRRPKGCVDGHLVRKKKSAALRSAAKAIAARRGRTTLPPRNETLLDARSKEDPREAKARDRGHRGGLPRIAQALLVSSRPLLDQARRAPILRANPCPEVTDLTCRLPLPTFVYRPEAVNLGDLLRIWVRTGATPPRGPSPDFQGPRGMSGHRRNCGALRAPFPLSLLENSREPERSNRKENSSPTSRRLLRVSLGCPDELPARRRGIRRERFRYRVPE